MAANDSIARDFHDDINGKAHHEGEDPEETLQRIKTTGTGSVTISSDLFEKLYLQPKFAGPPLKHPLQSILGNPTALGIIGFEMSLMPITMQLLEWRGAKGSRSANNADVIFYGGVLMWITGILEFILGNTFPFLVFTMFGSFYASYGATLIPWFATYASFSTDVDNEALGATTQGFNASYGHYWAAFCVLWLLFTICAARTNIVFLTMFILIEVGVCLVTAVFYHTANGNAGSAHDCQKAAGGVLFAACMVGWYLFSALLFPSVDFPIPLPLGDLQQIVPGLSDLRAGKAARSGRSIFRKKKQDIVEDAV
ncbi:hypothetical protein AC579_7839 [Pseudocercospora musae]|uniref:GPR1/FUN34/YaaH-class plasma membrane protein n=1 Tax=Pseudocercospora musae TaxID=113226 RepID=A0A139I708_9PEZI|nr:hypothetical protein AC579_7839 [Pseudocercospora musae]